MAAPPKDLAVQPLANKAPTSYLEEVKYLVLLAMIILTSQEIDLARKISW